MKSGRQKEPRIQDIHTHRRDPVGLRVAAKWLGLSEQTLIARVDEGYLEAVHDGRVWQFRLSELQRYDTDRRRLKAS